MEKGNFSINSENIMPIIKKWLYSDTDIFLRELVSNGVDAINKLKKIVDMGEHTLDLDNEHFEVRVKVDKDNKTITITDNGLGMTADEINRFINQIAFSGATDFVEKYQDNLSGDEIIGHFGLGFYSAFMVADKVTIDTKSYKDEPGATWVSDGVSEYEIGPSEKTTRGTEITLYVNPANEEEFLKEYKIREVLTKYCAFMPVDVVVETTLDNEDLAKPINKTPLWVKNPKDCTDEEYKQFYKETFNDFNDPLFWIHLNMDYPFTLKGILYFPKLRHEMEQVEGQVKLFCNQVFVADNVKEVIPEFLLLLKGVLDCPDIPLNVSRSFLQNDTTVSKMSGYVARKVADRLNSIYKKDKETYEKYWNDISPFIKYGAIKEKTFYEKMEPAIIYKTTTDQYVTLTEYLEANKDKHENKVYYATNKAQQAQYIKMFADQGMEAVLLETGLDTPFISYLESYKTDIKFARIDSHVEASEDTEDEASESITSIFQSVLGEKQKIKVQKLKSQDIPAVILLSEEARRMKEMSAMFGGMDNPFPVENELVLNSDNTLVQALVAHKDNTEETALIVNHIYDIASMSQQPLDMEQMNAFSARTHQILTLLLNKSS